MKCALLLALAAIALAGCGGGQSKLQRLCAQGRRAAEAQASQFTDRYLAALPADVARSGRPALYAAALRADLAQFELAHRVDCRY